MCNVIRRICASRQPLLSWATWISRVLGVCVVLVVGFQLTDNPCEALAATGHSFVAAITEASDGGRLEEPGATTIERSTGNIFVADPQAGTIDVFSSSGAFITSFGQDLEATGVSVDEASGNVYVSSGNAVQIYKPAGDGRYGELSEWQGTSTPAGEFGEAAGVAVDNSSGPHAGEVYVVDAENDVVDAFRPKPAGPEETLEGTYVASPKGTRLEEPNAVAVDPSTGKVYVADSVKGVVDVFSSAGLFEGKITGTGAPEGSFRGSEELEGDVRAIAAEAGQLYVAETERNLVAQFDAAGEWMGRISSTPSGPLDEPAGLVVAPDGEVYVADAGTHSVDLFGPNVTVPDAITGQASNVGKITAVLNGVVNGDGKPAKYHFEWGTSEAYGATTPPIASGDAEEAAMTELPGLTTDTTYHYRIVAENENGTNTGVDRKFTTLPAVEALSTGPAQGLTTTSATLTGSLTPKGTQSFYYFQWGTDTAYGNSSPTPPGTDAGSGKTPVAAETDVTGLSPNTTYHYRLAGEDQYGVTYGEDRQVTTAGPPRITSVRPAEVTHEGATISAKLNPDELETTYRFQYGDTSSYGNETEARSAPAVESQEPVAASLSGLKIGTVYHYRLVATNSAGTTYEPDQTVETVPPALLQGTSASEPSASGATLQAEINPLGHQTTYYFQYGTEPCDVNPSPCTDLPAAPGANIGEGEVNVSVGQTIGGLAPSTTYNYRAVAINALGISYGPEETFTTPPTSTPPLALADNRAWELVSPPNKHGAPIEGLTHEGGVVLAAEDGNSITYAADGSIAEDAEGNRSPEQQQVMSTRTPTGWSTQDVATPNIRAEGLSAGHSPEYQFFTPDLSEALVEPWGTTPFAEPPLAAGAKQKTMYLRDNATGTYLPLVTEENVLPGTTFGHRLHFVSATPDLDHVVLHSEVPLTPAPAGNGLYEWTDGVLTFVSLLDDGVPAAEAELGFAGTVVTNAISDDGTRVIWTSKDENTDAGHLYMRDTATGQTLQIDAAQGVSEPEKGSAEYQGASADGSDVFFTDKQRLTVDSTAEASQGVGKRDLYECQVVEQTGGLECRLKDLTVEENEGEHAAVQGFLLGLGESGTYTYIVAQGVLASNCNGNGERAEPGRANLYALHEDADSAWTTTFIGTLSSEDSPEWEGGKTADPAFLTARVSPNGEWLAFMSNASLTGYDNVDADPAAHSARDEEVFLYHAGPTPPTLTCVSCNPSGVRPHGVLDTREAGEGLGLVVDRPLVWAESGHEHWLAGNIPGWTAESLGDALFQSRYLSNEGRLFFNSADPLVPQVTVPTREESIGGASQQVGVENVYEYEPLGVGSCQSPTGGCVSLISSGTSDRESAFLEATPSGNDVFFLTAAQLSPEDTDSAFDVYDARVCTEQSPCLTPPQRAPAGCGSTDACRPAEPAQPAPVEASATLTPGNALSGPKAAGGVKSSHTTKAKPLTRAQRLAEALRLCKRRYRHAKRRRATCEARAKREYRAHKKPNRSRPRQAKTSKGRRR